MSKMTEWMRYVCPEHGVVRLRKREHYEHDLRLASLGVPSSLKCRKCGTSLTAEPAPEVTALSEYLKSRGRKISKLSWAERCALHDLVGKLYRKIHPSFKPSGKGREARRILRLSGGDMLRSRWVDHTDFDGDTFISEPYNMGIPALKDLIGFAEAHGLELSISGRSWWNPGETLRIRLWRKRSERSGGGSLC